MSYSKRPPGSSPSPLRAVWFLASSAYVLVVSAARALIAAFVAYALALTISCLFLPAARTLALWEWADGLYAQSTWFKGATMTFFVLFLLPILKLWPGSGCTADIGCKRKTIRINNGLIAACQPMQAETKRRG